MLNQSNVMLSSETIDRLITGLEQLFDSGILSEVQHSELADFYVSLQNDDRINLFLGEQGEA